MAVTFRDQLCSRELKKEGIKPSFTYLIPNNFPNLFLLPLFDVGIPVAFAIFLLAFVTPVALFQEKERPGILNFFFAIIFSF